jgi:Fe-S cluster assembly iron-binding protein IscA
MLKVTPNAAAALTAARSDSGVPDTHGIRFFAASPAEAPDRPGRLAFEFVAAPKPDDAVAEHSGLKTYVAPEVEAAVGEATVDTEEVGVETHLVLRRG